MTETMNKKNIENWNEYVNEVSCPYFNIGDFKTTKKGISLSKPLLDSKWNFYVQQKDSENSFYVKLTGNGTSVGLYSVANLEDANLLFEDISEVVMILKKTYGYNKLKEVFEYLKEAQKYSIRPKNYFVYSDDGKIKVVVRAKGNEGYLPIVIDFEKGTNELKEHNSICSACPTFDEAKLECDRVLDEYNSNGYYVRNIQSPKFVLEHECLPTVEEPKTHTVELTDEQYELLQSILDGRK